MGATADREASLGYRSKLEQYLSASVLGRDQTFVCGSGGACRSSVESHGFDFAAGQLSYVGDGYACVSESRPIRIVIVSMQVGDAEAPVPMGRRADQVLDRVPERPGQRNPHMRGVVRALQLLHGLTAQPDDELLADGTHVLSAYAMANSVLCSALPTAGKSRRGKPTQTMLSNCSGHLAATLSILDPTIIHSQGVDTRAAIEAITTPIEQFSDEVSIVDLAGRQIVFCATSHPAAGPPKSWSSVRPGSYFAEVAKPALELTHDLALRWP